MIYSGVLEHVCVCVYVRVYICMYVCVTLLRYPVQLKQYVTHSLKLVYSTFIGRIGHAHNNTLFDQCPR